MEIIKAKKDWWAFFKGGVLDQDCHIDKGSILILLTVDVKHDSVCNDTYQHWKFYSPRYKKIVCALFHSETESRRFVGSHFKFLSVENDSPCKKHII